MSSRLLFSFLGAGALALFACKPASNTSPQGLRPIPGDDDAGPIASSAVRFTRRVPGAGLKAHRNRDLQLQLAMGTEVMRHTEHEALRYEVKESNESRIAKAGLDIQDLYDADQQGEEPEEKKINPLSGSSFLVTDKADGHLSAVDAAGKPVSEEQLSLLGENYGELFETDQVAASLPKDAVSIGGQFTPSRAALVQMLRITDDDDTTLEGVELILRRVEDNEAHFDVRMTMTWKMAGDYRLRARLSGTLSLQTATGWLTTLGLAGPVLVLDPKGDEMGKGTFSTRAQVSFEAT